MTDGELAGARLRGIDQIRVRDDGSVVLEIRETIETDRGAIPADVRGYAIPDPGAPHIHEIRGFALFDTAVPEYADYNTAVVAIHGTIDMVTRVRRHRPDRFRRSRRRLSGAFSGPAASRPGRPPSSRADGGSNPLAWGTLPMEGSRVAVQTRSHLAYRGRTMLRPGSEHPAGKTERTRERLLRRYARWQRPRDLEQLVISYQPLARALARRYGASACCREDLDQAAYEGLIKAIRRFEPERGVAFTSFAVPTILGELRRYLRDTAWPAHLPRSLQERVREVRAVGERLAAAQGRSPTVHELGQSLGCEDADVIEALAASSLSVLPLDAPAHDADAATVSVADQVGIEDPGFERVECLAAIEEALPALTSVQKLVLRLHFADDLTQRQIAGRLGISRSEVARDLGAAIARLRSVTTERLAA